MENMYFVMKQYLVDGKYCEAEVLIGIFTEDNIPPTEQLIKKYGPFNYIKVLAILNEELPSGRAGIVL